MEKKGQALITTVCAITKGILYSWKQSLSVFLYISAMIKRNNTTALMKQTINCNGKKKCRRKWHVNCIKNALLAWKQYTVKADHLFYIALIRAHPFSATQVTRSCTCCISVHAVCCHIVLCHCVFHCLQHFSYIVSEPQFRDFKAIFQELKREPPDCVLYYFITHYTLQMYS